MRLPGDAPRYVEASELPQLAGQARQAAGQTQAAERLGVRQPP